MSELGFEVLDRHRRLYRPASWSGSIRLLWGAGKVMLALGQLGRAETKFTVAPLAFSHQKKDFDAALVSLDLGLVLAARNRPKELAFLVEQMLATFQTLGVGQEILASVLLLKQACEESAPAERLYGQLEVLARVLRGVKRRHPAKKSSKKK